MSRTIRRKNHPEEHWYLYDYQWQDDAKGYQFLQRIALDPKSPEGRRKWHDLHRDCGKNGRWGVPRGWRNLLNRSTRVNSRTELVRAWRTSSEDALHLDARTRESGWNWF
jgi:hypothetical protein